MSWVNGKLKLIVVPLFFLIALPGQLHAECDSKSLILVNNSKHHLKFSLNDKALAILPPGDSLDDQGVLVSGKNTLVARVVSGKSGQLVQRFRPKRFKLQVTCSGDAQVDAASPVNTDVDTSDFKKPKKKASKKRVKKAGNKKGRSTDLTGTWEMLNPRLFAGSKLKITQLSDVLVAGTLTLSETTLQVEGYRLGSIVILTAKFPSGGTLALDLGVSSGSQEDELRGKGFVLDARSPFRFIRSKELDTSVSGVYSCFLPSGSSRLISVCRRPDGSMAVKASGVVYEGVLIAEDTYNFVREFLSPSGETITSGFEGMVFAVDKQGESFISDGAIVTRNDEGEETQRFAFEECTQSTVDLSCEEKL